MSFIDRLLVSLQKLTGQQTSESRNIAKWRENLSFNKVDIHSTTMCTETTVTKRCVRGCENFVLALA